MLKWLKRNWFFATILFLATVFAGGYSVYYVLSDESPPTSNLEIIDETPNSSDEDSIFSNLDAENLYSQIRMDTAGDFAVSDDMVAQLVQNVVNGLSKSDGALHVSTNRLSNSEVQVLFTWVSPDGEDKKSKQYVVKITT